MNARMSEQHDIKKYEYWSSEWRIVCDRYDVCCNITRASYDEWVSATIGDSGTHDTMRHIVLWIICPVEGRIGGHPLPIPRSS